MSTNIRFEIELDQTELERLGTLDTGLIKKTQALDSKEELCKIYNSYKPLIPIFLPILKKIPYGDKIVNVIETLMQIADFACAVVSK